jgi:photosystem II stability/assembly factor-like uncharacterized protein
MKCFYLLIFSLLFNPTLRAQWTQTNAFFGGNINTLQAYNSDIIAGTDQGFYKSVNNGNSWSRMNIGLGDTIIHALAVNGATIFAGTSSHGVFLSNDNGNSWLPANNGMSNTNVLSLLVNGANLFAGTENDGMFLSTDNGQNWTPINTGLINSPFRALTSYNGYIYAGTYGAGIFRTNDNGNNWYPASSNLTSPNNQKIYTLTATGSKIFAGTESGIISSTSGTFWNLVNWTLEPVTALNVYGNTIYAGTRVYVYNSMGAIGAHYGVHKSSDNGTTWSAANSGLSYYQVNSIVMAGTTLFAGTSSEACNITSPAGTGIYRSLNNGASWTSSNIGIGSAKVTSMAYGSGNLYAGTDGAGVHKSSDGGNTWTEINNGLLNYRITSVAVCGTVIFAGTFGSGLYKSTDNGLTWTYCTIPFTGCAINCFPCFIGKIHVTSANKIFIYAHGNMNDGTWTSTNNGTSWNLSVGLYGFADMCSNGSNIYAGGAWNTAGLDFGISNNSGFSWNFSGPNIINTWGGCVAIENIGSNLYAASDYSGLITSPDNGNTWNPPNYNIPFGQIRTNDIEKYATTVFVGSEGGVYCSNDNFITATNVNLGLLDTNINCLLVVGTDIYGGTYHGTIWKRSITEMFQVPAAAGQISGLTSVCQGLNAVIYSVAPVANATSYVWTLPNGATGTSSTNSIVVNFGSNAISGDITVSAVNYFGTGPSSTFSVSVNPYLTPAFSQITPICSGQTLNPLPTTSNNGVTGTWSPNINNTSTTTYTFTPSAGQCASNQSMTIVVNQSPQVLLSSFNSLCDTAGIVNLTGGFPIGGVYSGTSVSNNTFNTAIGVGTYPITYTYTNNGGCSSSATKNISVIQCIQAYLEELKQFGISLYPNPTHKEFTIESTEKNVGSTYEIFDASGRFILLGKLDAKINHVSVSDLAKGTYFIKITELSKVIKIVIL